MKRHSIERAIGLGLSILLSLGAIACQNSTDTPAAGSTYKDYLYMTDTYSGNVYVYDPSTRQKVSTSLVSTTANGTGEIAFYKGISYVCVGSGDMAGLYYFDPSATSPQSQKIGATVNAQYCAFASATKGYVTVASDWTNNTGELYCFNPSLPGEGLAKVAAITKYAQEAIVGGDGMLYVAQDRVSGEIVKIDPSSNAAVATYATGVSGTTGLVWGSYKGNAGAFVASTSGYIHFIAKGAAANEIVTVAAATGDSPIYPARLIQLANGNLAATGFDTSWINHTYLVDLSGSNAIVAEIKVNDAAFGALDIAYRDGLVYVPVNLVTYDSNYTKTGNKNYLYVFDAEGKSESYSPVSVMTDNTDGISNIGFFE
jgi:hypothetical protein